MRCEDILCMWHCVHSWARALHRFPAHFIQLCQFVGARLIFLSHFCLVGSTAVFCGDVLARVSRCFVFETLFVVFCIFSARLFLSKCSLEKGGSIIIRRRSAFGLFLSEIWEIFSPETSPRCCRG